MDYAAFFKKNEYNYTPDAELCGLFDQTLTYMSEEKLSEYIVRMRRFNKGTVHVIGHHDGEYLADMNSPEEIVHWYDMRECLKQVPQIYEASRQLNISDEKTTEIIFALEEYQKYDFSHISDQLKVYSEVLDSCIEKEKGFVNAIPAFHAMLKKGEEDGEICRALGNLGLCVKAGMTPEQGIDIVNDIYDKSSIAGYAFMSLYDSLYWMQANNIEGDVLYNTYRALMGNNPYYTKGSFPDFAELMQIAATNTPLSQNEILNFKERKAIEGAPDKKGKLSVSDVIANRIKLINKAGNTYKKAPDNYFPDIKTKKIIPGMLPYSINKNFQDGLADLKELCKDDTWEGAYIYAPETETWYSLGGRTHLKCGGARHEFQVYDVSLLSKSPVVVHIHPEKNEILISPDRERLEYSQLQIKITKFLSAMPSGADYQMCSEIIDAASSEIKLASFIVNSIGVTEMVIPHDDNRISAGKCLQLSKRFKEIKDTAINDFYQEGYVLTGASREPDNRFVQRLVDNINPVIEPESFKILLHHNQF